MTSDPNPYEPPREEAAGAFSFREADSEVVELRRRVEQLERRLGKNWLVSPNQFFRILGIWGYLALGYILVMATGWTVIGLISLAMYLLGRRGPFG